MKELFVNVKLKYNLIYGLLGGFIVLNPFLYDCFHGLERFANIFVAFYLLSVVFLLKLIWMRRRKVGVNRMDLLLILYLGWGVCSMLFVKKGGTDPLLIFEWISLLLCYLSARGAPNRAMPVLFGAFVLSGCVQSVVGLLQWNAVVLSNHSLFPFTGSFMNPGPYGGYLAVCWIVGGGWAIRLLKAGKRRQAVLLVVPVLLISPVLAASESRAAWLAVLSASGYLIYRFAGKQLRFGRRIRITAVVVAVAVAVGIYLYKKDSADARLLIWRASWGMFRDAPGVGSGIGTFASHYMDAQGDYLAADPDSRFVAIADNNQHAFNEWVRLGCEQGLIGLLLFAGIIGFAFGKSCGGRFQRPVRAGLLGLLVFSFFSYPSEVYPLKCCYAVLLGMIRIRPVRTIGISTGFRAGIVCLTLLTAGMALRFHLRYERAARELELYARLPSTANLDRVKNHLADVIYNPDFLWQYCQLLYLNRQYSECIGIYPVYHAHVRKTTETLCDLGNCCISAYQFREAERCFRSAQRMIPTRIFPLYGLFRLYRAEGRTAQAIRMACTLVDCPVEIVNSITIRIKADARNYLKGISGGN